MYLDIISVSNKFAQSSLSWEGDQINSLQWFRSLSCDIALDESVRAYGT